MARRTLEDLRRTSELDSLRWFPGTHRSPEDRLKHCALGLAGETGEAVDIVKKWDRDREVDIADLDREAFGAELADVLIYLLHIATVTGIDLEREFVKKRVINERRFG